MTGPPAHATTVEATSGSRRGLAALLLVALIGGVALLSRLPRARSMLDSILDLAKAGSWRAWAAFAAVQVAVAAFGVLPASLMAIAAGAAYGLWAGFLLSATGTMIGGWIAFCLSRSVLRPSITKLLARGRRFRAFDEAIVADGWRFVCLMRISPVMPFAVTSYGLGLTGVKMRDFLIGTLASLPALFGYVAVGVFGQAGVTSGRSGDSWLRAALLVVGMAAVLVAVARLQAVMRRRLVPTGPA